MAVTNAVTLLGSGQRDTAPTWGTVAYSSGTAQTAGRAIVINVTAAGNNTFVFEDASSITINFVNTGVFEFNWAVTTWTLGSGTATCNNLL